MSQPLVDAVGAVVLDDAGRLLLVLRAHEPSRRRWSLPGGHVERRESSENAVVREVREETGLDVVVTSEIGSVLIDGLAVQYAVRDFRCAVLGGHLQAADDALDAQWFELNDVKDLPTSPGLVEQLTRWGVLPETG